MTLDFVQPKSSTSDEMSTEISSPDILVVSRTFLPKEGGIEEYVYNRCLQDPTRVVVLTASCEGDEAFDQVQSFSVHRWPVPAFLRSRLLSNVPKQILYMFWSLVLGIKLYFRYRYHYIEWGHGYDFPVLLLLTYLLPVRCFIYLHGNDLLCPLRNPVVRLLFELTLKRVQGIVCNSSFTRDYLKAHFQFDTPTYVINPSVRPEKFAIEGKLDDYLEQLRTRVRQQYNIPETAVVILSVGRLVRRKGFDRVIKNLPLLLAKGLDVHYLIGGRGSMETELRTLTSQLQVEERVHFAGYVPDKQLAGFYAACDLFAMLTYFDAKAASIEGFGIVYLEAGYFGKPVIASRIGGVEDAVHHGESGILVEPNSTDEIFKGLQQLCEDQQLLEKLGRKGQELANRKTYHRRIYQWIIDN